MAMLLRSSSMIELTFWISLRLSASALQRLVARFDQVAGALGHLVFKVLRDWSSATDISPIDACSSPTSPPVVTAARPVVTAADLAQRADRRAERQVRLRARKHASAPLTTSASAAIASSIRKRRACLSSMFDGDIVTRT